MMSNNRINFTLKLIPIIGQDEFKSPLKEAGHDDWLNNDDVSLLDTTVVQNTKATNEQGLNQLLDQLVHHSSHRIHQKETLEIKSMPNGFVLIDGNKLVVLQDDDVIRLPTILLKVKIQQEHIVNYDSEKANDVTAISSAPEIEDIWSSSHEANYQGNRFADPFAFSGTTHQKDILASQQDPLDFLYHPNSGGSRSHFRDDGLTINTKQYSNSAAPSLEGNVLNDLGIDESSSTIAQRNYHSGKTSYLEQSPMDMLDEYLDTSETISYDSNIPNFSPQSFRFQEPFGVNSSDHYIHHNTNQYTTQPSISNACKKLLKVFVD